MKILVVEDDLSIAMGIEYSLGQEGYEVKVCGNVAEGKAYIENEVVDLCLLDLTLPDGSGYELCKVAKENRDIPVIFLTACDDEVNVVMGLDMGADDYVTKPFRIRELISRIKSVLRRHNKTDSTKAIFNYNNIRINTLEAKVYKNNKEVQLTALEYRLLLTFITHEGQALSRNQLLEGIWDIAGDFVNDNTVTVYIKRLRDKLEDDPGNPTFITTIRGIGYKVGR
ncbi:response regulator transcription factor [Cellulosilyticum lentocellum]|uniref:Stage 0 sporulation protein A homolog n=1 Tax=Cellulosilyticum lentocellum (strain ATCC 49066 / DSM 5427 / NCIMB 11756 / RHM5) TaxID=642492 RepID=F2JL77_CELLD|nr:response regulator transcription factor [Cellulosilyticum lentocellum]ADZ85722.1 two component transcriptional regulator, winged helix family [Cellulosilyticum lentocellum DSM 5427]